VEGHSDGDRSGIADDLIGGQTELQFREMRQYASFTSLGLSTETIESLQSSSEQ
jgi:hypothetical protein